MNTEEKPVKVPLLGKHGNIIGEKYFPDKYFEDLYYEEEMYNMYLKENQNTITDEQESETLDGVHQI